jgi:hypothetical protein
VFISNNQYDLVTPETLGTRVLSGGAKANGAQWRGIGSPEGVVASSVGSTFQRTDGWGGNSLFVKEAGAGNTGWFPVSKLVAVTANGDAAAENGAGTWAKIATLTSGSIYVETQVTLAVSASGYMGVNAATTGDVAIINAVVKSQTASAAPTVRVSMLAKPDTKSYISPDSFKIIAGVADAAGKSTAELWVRKDVAYGFLTFYELGKSLNNTTSSVTYNNGAAWQSAVPTNTVTASSAGVTAFGSPVLTAATGVQGSAAGTAAGLTLWTGTKAQYDAITSKSATTIYVVTSAAATLEGIVDGVTGAVDTGQISSEETALESAQAALGAVQTGDITVDPPARTATTKSTRKK